MKKLIILPMCAALACISNAAVAADNDIIFVGKKSYGCNNSSGQWNFQDGTYLQTVGHSSLNGKSRGYHRRYKCNASNWNPAYDDHWTEVSINWCSGSDVKEIGLSDVTYTLYDHNGVSYGSDGAALNGGCLMGKRKIDPAEEKAEKAAEEACQASGGFWWFGQCNCPDSKGLKQTADKKKCECAKSGDVFNSATKTCEAPKPTVDPEQLRRACLDSGGDWKKGEVGFSISGWKSKCVCDAKIGLVPTLDDLKCECKNSAEKYDASKKKCVVPGKGGNGGYNPVPVPSPKPAPKPQPKPTTPSEVDKARSACEGAVGAVWNETSKLCSCSDTNYEWNGTACVALLGYVQCKTLVSAGTATWNSETKVCMCMQTGYVFNGTACVETAESIAARKAEQAQAAKAAIASVHSKLKKTQSGFDVSAWKNAEGNFNTARLASDSIAGVVLGTTGALVTSTVVKKNQVENGFEDIQCTIGGQTVAQWGDEFSVGAQF